MTVKIMSAIAGLSIALASTRVVGFAPRQAPTARLPIYGFTVVRSYPHDPAAFTQGLEFEDGVLYEGTGLNGRSSIRRVNLETGNVLQQHNIGAQYFGEGITLVGSTASDPTWRKWQPCDPTSPHWYDAARLRRLMGAYIARDEDHGRDQRTVREFISEFRGAEWQREAEARARRGRSRPTVLTGILRQ